MICDTIRQGQECTFMATSGCSYNGGKCYEMVEACKGCNRGAELPTGLYCAAYPEPALKWKNGNCNLATHVEMATDVGSTAKINPLKASKRAAR